MKVVNLIQGSHEWHGWRKNGIGSSDIAKIMGVSPFGNALSVYNEKAGFSMGPPENQAMRTGKKYEPRALELFNGNRFELYPACIESEEYPFMRASLDGWDGTSMLCEIKVPGEKDMSLAKEGIVPDYYNTQMQWQMMLSGCKITWYVCYSVVMDEIYEIPVQFDPQYGETLKNSAIQFWENFLHGIPPEDKYDWINDPQFSQEVRWYTMYDEQIKEKELQREHHKKNIISFNKGRSFKGEGLTVLQTEPRTSYDYKAMERDGIDLSKYKKQGEPGWRITRDK